MADDGLLPRLFANVVRSAGRFAGGMDPDRPRGAGGSNGGSAVLRARGRQALDAVAARAGYSRSYPEPEGAGHRLAAFAGDLPALDRAYRTLADEPSRALFVELLTFRALGAAHTQLPVSAEAYRAHQARLERECLVEHGTLAVEDPFADRLDRFRLPARRHDRIEINSHSAALVAIFVLEQYAYPRAEPPVRARPGDVVIDAGGCWGDSALYFADLVAEGAAGEVHSFEFSPDSLAVLERNLALNPRLAGRVHVVQSALWERSDEILEFEQLGQLTSLTRAGPGTGEKLATRTITLDDFVDQSGLPRVDLIKMDIEGAELAALRGAEGTLRRHRPALAIAAYHRPEDLAEIPAWIDGLGIGYRLFLGHASAAGEETVVFARAAD